MMAEVPVNNFSARMSLFLGSGKIAGKLARNGTVTAGTRIEMEESRHCRGNQIFNLQPLVMSKGNDSGYSS
jgi:hypothetical protein